MQGIFQAIHFLTNFWRPMCDRTLYDTSVITAIQSVVVVKEWNLVVTRCGLAGERGRSANVVTSRDGSARFSILDSFSPVNVIRVRVRSNFCLCSVSIRKKLLFIV